MSPPGISLSSSLFSPSLKQWVTWPRMTFTVLGTPALITNFNYSSPQVTNFWKFLNLTLRSFGESSFRFTTLSGIHCLPVYIISIQNPAQDFPGRRQNLKSIVVDCLQRLVFQTVLKAWENWMWQITKGSIPITSEHNKRKSAGQKF